MTLRSFELAIDKFIRETVPDEIQTMQRVITLQALQGVVFRTPVDTGRARGNWQVSLEAPVLDVLASEDKVGGGTVSAGNAVIGGIKPFSITFVQNNLPYIEALEDGSSKQAPAGMVAVTVADIERQFL